MKTIKEARRLNALVKKNLQASLKELSPPNTLEIKLAIHMCDSIDGFLHIREKLLKYYGEKDGKED